MKIDDNLNLVLDVGDGMKLYHTPISAEVFEANFRILALTKADLAANGIHYQMESGPRVATLLLKDNAEKSGMADHAQALLAEIKRLSMVLVPGDDGWKMTLIDSAIKAGQIDAEDWLEVESALVFFTCHCSMATRRDRAGVVSAVASLLLGFATSLPCMELAASLPELMKGEAIVESVESSVPC